LNFYVRVDSVLLSLQTVYACSLSREKQIDEEGRGVAAQRVTRSLSERLVCCLASCWA